MLDNTVIDDKDIVEQPAPPRALDKVRREYRLARKGERRELYCFAHFIFFLERALADLEDEEDCYYVVIPRSATPEMLIDAKERIALATKQLAAFAARIDEKIEAQVRRAA